jgi:ornithine cyclodeaminase
MKILDAEATRDALPWPPLIAALQATIADAAAGDTTCPPRTSVTLGGDDVWLLMPAVCRTADVAACKLLTVHPGNPDRGRPLIQGDVLVIRASNGDRVALLDGPAVTARRTAAATALALQRIRAARGETSAPDCLIIGCGVQGRSHLEALHATLPGIRFMLASRTRASAAALRELAAARGIKARVVDDPDHAVDEVDIVVCCTPAFETCLHRPPRDGGIVAAIGSFKPAMSELGPAVMAAVGGNILLDSPDAAHEAGELVQAGIDGSALPTLLDGEAALPRRPGATVLFKSCGNALWDLAAARALLEAPFEAPSATAG